MRLAFARDHAMTSSIRSTTLATPVAGASCGNGVAGII
jgi:hypothetical protein